MTDSDDTDTTVTTTNSLTPDDHDKLKEAFLDGRFEGVLSEHEGCTQTLLFEVPSGHLGLSITAAASAEGDIHLSVSEWEKEQHHELDEWVWVRGDDDQ